MQHWTSYDDQVELKEETLREKQLNSTRDNSSAYQIPQNYFLFKHVCYYGPTIILFHSEEAK